MILVANRPETGRFDAFEIEFTEVSHKLLGGTIAYLVDCGYSIELCSDDAYQGHGVSHGLKTVPQITEILTSL